MRKIQILFSRAALIAAVILLAASCSKKLQSGSATADVLKYKYEEGKNYHYLNHTEVDQLIIYGGQEIGALINSYMGYMLTGLGQDNEGIKLRVKVDSIVGSAESMQGNMKNDAKDVRGKEFTMTLTPDGIESNLDEAEKIRFMGIGDQASNLKASFTLIFQDLPTESIKIGYTWSKTDTVDMSFEGQNAFLILNSINTIEAKETRNGYDCYKITSSYTGERNSSGETPQGFMSTSGSVKGTGVMYFAPGEGLVVEDSTNQKFDGEISIPTGESIPMIMDIKVTNKLIR